MWKSFVYIKYFCRHQIKWEMRENYAMKSLKNLTRKLVKLWEIWKILEISKWKQKSSKFPASPCEKHWLRAGRGENSVKAKEIVKITRTFKDTTKHQAHHIKNCYKSSSSIFLKISWLFSFFNFFSFSFISYFFPFWFDEIPEFSFLKVKSLIKISSILK